MRSTDLKIIELEEIDSTSDYLKKNYHILSNFTVIKTEYQTKGRGQFDRVWQSKKGENIMFSLLLKNYPITRIKDIKTWILKSLIESLEKYHLSPRFKEPNDLYIEDKKICGILIETLVNDDHFSYVIIGIGMNINQTFFEGLNATSFKLTKNKSYDTTLVFTQIIKDLIKNYDIKKTH